MDDDQSDLGAIFALLLIVFGVGLVYLFYKAFTSEEAEDLMEGAAKIFALMFILPALLLSLGVRYGAGVIGDRLGASQSVGQLALVVIVISPLVVSFWCLVGLAALALTGQPTLAHFLFVLSIMVLPVEVLAYYLSWWTNRVPLSGMDIRLDVPYQTDTKAYTEARLFVDRAFQILLVRHMQFRVHLWELIAGIAAKLTKG